MTSKWTRPGGYSKQHSKAIGTFTKHRELENCWIGFVEGRSAIAYLRKIRPDSSEDDQECLVIFDDPNVENWPPPLQE